MSGYAKSEALVPPEYITKMPTKIIRAGKFAYNKNFLKDVAFLFLRIMLSKITKYTTATN
jgi:hypothetical protein